MLPGRLLPVALALVAVALGASGCGGDSRQAGTGGPAGTAAPRTGGTAGLAGASGACAAIVLWDGGTYEGTGLAIGAQVGEPVGRGTIPACNDTGGTDERDETVTVRQIAGVDPRAAVALGTDGTIVYVRAGLDGLPPALEELRRVPACADPEPVRLRAVWTGIVHPPGYTVEFDGDIGPGPYDLELYVVDGPDPLLRAQLTVHATRETENPLGPRDVKQILWKGGTLSMTVRCAGDGTFVVDALDANR